MDANSINLGVRFLLEVASLISLGAWGWSLGEGNLKFIYALAIPVFAMVMWGVFAVPNDPSRSGAAPIPVPGLIRLALEISLFTVAIFSLISIRQLTLAWMLGIVVSVHYIYSYERILWLLRQ